MHKGEGRCPQERGRLGRRIGGNPASRHFLPGLDLCPAFTFVKAKCVSHSVVSDSLWSHGLQPIRLLCSWNSPGKNNGVGCHALLQGIFPTQGWDPGLLHCRQIFFTVWATREVVKAILSALRTFFPWSGKMAFCALRVQEDGACWEKNIRWGSQKVRST